MTTLNHPVSGNTNWFSDVDSNWTTIENGINTARSIATGGTNATSFGTTNGVVYYDGTRLVNSTNLTFNGTNLTAANAATFNAGVILSNTSGNTALAYSRQGTFTSACTGPIPSTNVTVSFTRVGNSVTLTCPSVRVNGNSTSATIDMSALPSYLYPVTTIYMPVLSVSDAGNDQVAPGVLGIRSDGTIIIYKTNGTFLNFSASATTTGFYGWTISYEIA